LVGAAVKAKVGVPVTEAEPVALAHTEAEREGVR
jgi:hypothetical protein